MNEIQTLQALAALGWFGFVVMFFAASIINESWYQRSVQLNDKWFERCNLIIKQFSKAKHKSEDDDNVE